jgi:predicted transcriptional regulator of viral defense system
MRGQNDRRAWLRLIAGLADRQHGVVSRVQLLAAGVPIGRIERLVTAGWLRPIHPGVYAVGYGRLTREGRWLAAVLACGDRAVLSHRSAAALWQLRRRVGGPIEVTIAGRRSARTIPGLTIHRPTRLMRVEVTVRSGIPVTTVARTLLDLGGTSETR